MMAYVETSEMGVSILSNGVGKPFLVHPSADDDLLIVAIVLRFLELITLQLEHKALYQLL